jgi:orotate phosphoribosyltransferase
MKEYQEKFTIHLISTGALILQPTRLKSGRLSPYYVSLRRAVDAGQKLTETAKAYSEEIISRVSLDFDYIHGPAYAGIPLTAMTAATLWKDYGVDKRWGYDRKEEKSYGEKGQELIVGDLRDIDTVLILDDVITTGKTKIENWQKIKSLRDHLKLKGILIAIDREERDESGEPTDVVLEKAGFKVYSILKITEVFEWLWGRQIGGKLYVTDSIYYAFNEYFGSYGIAR